MTILIVNVRDIKDLSEVNALPDPHKVVTAHKF